ncbi:MAG: hypothetical protein MJ162_02320 [Treponema sp.]|nr:hypothetical protein [Treponema sp.]
MKKFISFILSVFIFSLSLCSCVNNFEHGENFSFEIKAADLIKSIRAASLDDFGEDAYTDEYYKITATLTGSKGTVNTQNQYFLCEGDEEDNIYSQETIKFNFNNLPVNQTWNISVYVQRESENCSSTELYALQNDIIIEKNKTVTANLQFIQDERYKEITTVSFYEDSDFASIDGSEYIYTSKTDATSDFYLSYIAQTDKNFYTDEYAFTAVFETPEKTVEIAPVEVTTDENEDPGKIDPAKNIYLPLAFGKKGVYKLTVTLKHKENGSYVQKKYAFYCGSINTGYVMYNGGSLLYPSYPDRSGNGYSYDDFTFDSKGNIYFFSTYGSTSITHMAPAPSGSNFENLYLDDSDFELKKIAFDRKTDKLYCLSEVIKSNPKQYSLLLVNTENKEVFEYISGDIAIEYSPNYGIPAGDYHIAVSNNCLYLFVKEQLDDETEKNNYDIKLYKYAISESSQSLSLELLSTVSFAETLGSDFNSEYVHANDILVEENTIYTLFNADNFEINYKFINENIQHKLISYGGIAIFNDTDSGMKYLKTVGCNNKKQIYKQNSVPLYTNIQAFDGSGENKVIDKVYINTAEGSSIPDYSRAFFPGEIQISDYAGASYNENKVDYIISPGKFIAIKSDRICISEYGYNISKASGDYKYLVEPKVSIIGFNPETYSLTLDEEYDREYPEVFMPKYNKKDFENIIQPSISGDNFFIYDEMNEQYINAGSVYCPLLVVATEEELNNTY